VNRRILALVVIFGFLLNVGSVYLNHAVFADDSWADIVARQHASEQNSLAKYTSHYKFTSLDQTKVNWNGLTSTPTDETTRGRNIDAQTQVSLQNAISQFDSIHANQIANLTSNEYKGLSNIPTDSQGRDRNVLIASARQTSAGPAQDILNQLTKIQQNYNGLNSSLTTDTSASYDRQTYILNSLANQEAKSATLVNQLAKIDGVYINLDKYVNTNTPYEYKSGSITNELTNEGRNISAQQAYGLEKAIMIFNFIHAQHVTALKSSYNGLTNTPTDTQGRDRNVLIEQEKTVSLTNALRVLNP
jgi:hypothetical protein